MILKISSKIRLQQPTTIKLFPTRWGLSKIRLLSANTAYSPVNDPLLLLRQEFPSHVLLFGRPQLLSTVKDIKLRRRVLRVTLYKKSVISVPLPPYQPKCYWPL